MQALIITLIVVLVIAALGYYAFLNGRKLWRSVQAAMGSLVTSEQRSRSHSRSTHHFRRRNRLPHRSRKSVARLPYRIYSGSMPNVHACAARASSV